MLLAVPCARDPVEVMTQGHNLRTGFINYLQQKHAAGIVNIHEPGSNQVLEILDRLVGWNLSFIAIATRGGHSFRRRQQWLLKGRVSVKIKGSISMYLYVY